MKTNNRFEKLWWKKIFFISLYLDNNDLYAKTMSQKLPVNDFEWYEISKFRENVIKNMTDNDDAIRDFLKGDSQYFEQLRQSHAMK